MSLGIQDGRVPPKFLLEKTLAQVEMLAQQKPEDSPLALPLKKFPPSISAADQVRIRTEMLDAIQKQDLPAYQRFARFMKVSYIPAGRAEPGIGALSDGPKYYQFLIRRSTTTTLTADQIHQIGLDEVKKDEAAMLDIAQKLGFKDLAGFRASLKTNPSSKATRPKRCWPPIAAISRPCRPGCQLSSVACPKRRLKWSRCRIHGDRPRRPPITRQARSTVAVPAVAHQHL